MDNGGHRINIARWNITYLAAGGGPGADLCGRLDKMVRTEVAEVCAGRLTQALTADDLSVWLIRGLNLNITVGTDPSQAESAAKQLGEGLASSIQKTIARGDEDGSVLHFPSRPAYLAQFVRDVATGIASGKWYYEEFSSLLSLPASRAISEALAGNPADTGDAIVSLIAIRGLQQVLSRLTESDARSIFETWQNALHSSSGTQETVWVGRLLQVWSETPYRVPGTGHEYRPFRDGLWWAALASSRHSGAGTEGAALETVKRLLELRSLLSALDHKGREEVIQCLARGDVEAAKTVAVRQGAYDPHASLEFFGRTMKGDHDWAREVQGVLLGEQEYLKKTPAPKVIAHGPAIPSPHAGIFRLGPSFLASGCQGALADLDSGQAALVRHLVAVKCLGRQRATGAAIENAVRLFSGFSESLGDTLASPTLTGWGLSGLHGSQGSCWLLDVVDHAIVLRDVLEDEWVWASLFGQGQADWENAVDQGVSWVARLSDTSSPVVLMRANRATSARGLIPLGQDPAVVEQLARDLHIAPQRLERGLRSMTEDFAYFSVREVLPELPPQLDLAATLLARAVLKHFARRLVGFANSSSEHLYKSFLTGVGFVRDTGERLEVELPQPPLSIVLSLAGMLEEVYTLPWIERREICLLRSSE